MGRMYTATFEEIAVTTAVDLFEIVAPADSVVIVHGFEISQSSDAGDAASEQLAILVHLGSTSGSGGAAETARPLNLGDAAFGGTVESNNTTQSTEGTFLHAAAFNIMNGYVWIPTPEMRFVISPSDRVIIELQTVPADELTLNGVVYFEEIGG